jgi:hypothetical protein
VIYSLVLALIYPRVDYFYCVDCVDCVDCLGFARCLRRVVMLDDHTRSTVAVAVKLQACDNTSTVFGCPLG